jgi:hypothetical protein
MGADLIIVVFAVVVIGGVGLDLGIDHPPACARICDRGLTK